MKNLDGRQTDRVGNDLFSRARWIIPLGYLVWIAPYLINTSRFIYLALSFAFLGIVLIFKDNRNIKVCLSLLWPLVAIILACLLVSHSTRALFGTVICILSILGWGIIVDAIFFNHTDISKDSKEGYYLYIPYLFGQGALACLIFLCAFGLILNITYLFWLTVLLPLPVLFFKAKSLVINWNDKDDSKLRVKHYSTGKIILIVCPIILILIKFWMFIPLGRTIHAETYVPMIYTIAYEDNFPVRCPPPDRLTEIHIPSANGQQYSLNTMCNIGSKMGGFIGSPDDFGSFWHGHYGGEVLLAMWTYFSGLHPWQTFRWGQLFSTFVLLGWFALVFNRWSDNRQLGTIITSMLFLQLPGYDYLDLELNFIVIGAFFWLVFFMSKPATSSSDSNKTIFYLMVVVGVVAYTTYGGTFGVLFAAFIFALSVCWIINKFSITCAKIPVYCRFSTVLTLIGAIVLVGVITANQGIFAGLIQRVTNHPSRTFHNIVKNKESQYRSSIVNKAEKHFGSESTQKAHDTQYWITVIGNTFSDLATGKTKYLMNQPRVRYKPLTYFLVGISCLFLLLIYFKSSKLELDPTRWWSILLTCLPATFIVFQLINMLFKAHYGLNLFTIIIVFGFNLMVFMLAFVAPAGEKLWWIFIGTILTVSPLAMLAIEHAYTLGFFTQHYIAVPYYFGLHLIILLPLSMLLSKPGVKLFSPIGILCMVLWASFVFDSWTEVALWHTIKSPYARLEWGMFYK